MSGHPLIALFSPLNLTSDINAKLTARSYPKELCFIICLCGVFILLLLSGSRLLVYIRNGGRYIRYLVYSLSGCHSHLFSSLSNIASFRQAMYGGKRAGNWSCGCSGKPHAKGLNQTIDVVANRRGSYPRAAVALIIARKNSVCAVLFLYSETSLVRTPTNCKPCYADIFWCWERIFIDKEITLYRDHFNGNGSVRTNEVSL